LGSLSVEYCDDEEREKSSCSSSSSSSSSFVVAAFDVDLIDDQRWAFMEREASYDIVAVPFYDIDDDPPAVPPTTGQQQRRQDEAEEEGRGRQKSLPSPTVVSTKVSTPHGEPLGKGVICL